MSFLTQEGDPGDSVPRCPWCFPPRQSEWVDSNVWNLHLPHCLDWPWIWDSSCKITPYDHIGVIISILMLHYNSVLSKNHNKNNETKICVLDDRVWLYSHKPYHLCNKLGTWSVVWHTNFDSDSDKMIAALLTWTQWYILQVTTTGTVVKTGRPKYMTCQSNGDTTRVLQHGMRNFAVPTHLITMGCTAAQSYLDLKMDHDHLK